MVETAAAELYSADPESFVARRKELASQARTAGDAAAAKQITALGKPTKAAWLVNRLVRADPSVPARLAELGEQLRSSATSLDAAGIRKLSAARRELIDALVGQALGPAEQRQAALRDEVADTFNAALADPEVAGQVAAGRVLRAAQWAGFGFGAGDPAAAFAASTSTSRAAPAKAGRSTAPAAATASGTKAEQAQAALADAASAAQAAAADHRVQLQAVRAVEKQLADNRAQVADAQQAFQAAQHQLTQAQRALAQASQRQEDAEERLVGTRKLLAEARKDLGEAEARVKQTAAAHRKAAATHDRA